ncbi:hypothetical protein M885DRAFT_548100 [Pelagophyceae sp. CCMP2097]|nr:hypothetical protein M885DRAFT_548100 [Pelagophyceae sp. CCMP2097]
MPPVRHASRATRAPYAFMRSERQDDGGAASDDDALDDFSLSLELVEAATRRAAPAPHADDDGLASHAAAEDDDGGEVAFGLGLVCASGFMFSIVSVFVKVAAQELHSLEVAWLASVVRGPRRRAPHRRRFARAAARGPRARRRPILLRRARLWLRHVRPPTSAALRAFALCAAADFGCRYAFGVLPLGDAASIIFSSPAWATVVAFFVLGERIDAVGVGAILASIGGVVLISRPSFLFGRAASAPGCGVASLVALLGSVSAAAAMLIIRAIGKRGGERAAVMSHASALFNLNVLVAPLALLAAPNASMTIWGPRRFSLFPTALCCFGAGAFGVGNQYLNNWGAQKAPAGLCSMMRNTDVAFSFV